MAFFDCAYQVGVYIRAPAFGLFPLERVQRGTLIWPFSPNNGGPGVPGSPSIAAPACLGTFHLEIM